ncbi:hypothetical protein [Brevibacillus migulae]|uniref:hypothetical protein n=1 Tax=Brevibacillus migulae TaxID=1644114 RepID=UPI00106E6C27|nr:hypothetical protein [Brevibacillus migulae]
MIPDEIKRLLHDIRLIGGGIKKYESGDDMVLMRNLIGEGINVDLMDATPENWDRVKAALEQEKSKAQEIMDARYNHGLTRYNPFS